MVASTLPTPYSPLFPITVEKSLFWSINLTLSISIPPRIHRRYEYFLLVGPLESQRKDSTLHPQNQCYCYLPKQPYQIHGAPIYITFCIGVLFAPLLRKYQPWASESEMKWLVLSFSNVPSRMLRHDPQTPRIFILTPQTSYYSFKPSGTIMPIRFTIHSFI